MDSGVASCKGISVFYFITSDSILDGQTLLWPMAQVMSAFPDQISLLGKFQASSSILCFCTSGWLAYNCAFNKSGILCSIQLFMPDFLNLKAVLAVCVSVDQGTSA